MKDFHSATSSNTYSFALAIPLVQINIGLLADQVGVTTTDTLDSGQGVHDLLLSIDVGVEETENELDYDSKVNTGIQEGRVW